LHSARVNIVILSLSLHDALPIYQGIRDEPDSAGRDRQRLGVALVHQPSVAELLGESAEPGELPGCGPDATGPDRLDRHALEYAEDRKSTRLNSSHVEISYAVFCF